MQCTVASVSARQDRARAWRLLLLPPLLSPLCFLAHLVIWEAQTGARRLLEGPSILSLLAPFFCGCHHLWVPPRSYPEDSLSAIPTTTLLPPRPSLPQLP